MAQRIKHGSTFVNDATVGTIDWTNPDNAQSSDDSWASVALGKGVISHYLKITNFGFTIPNATINWIKVTIERHASNVLVYDYSVKLVKGGTIQGDDKPTATGWPASDTNEDHGGTDKWGLTLLYTDVNASDFGCVISAKNYKTRKSTYTGYIDDVTITIDYTVTAGANQNSHIIDAINSNPLGTAFVRPQFFKDSHNTLHCVYYAGRDVMHAWSDDEGTTWNRELIYTETDLYPVAIMTIGSDDTLYAIWDDHSPTYYKAKMSIKPYGGSWGAPTDVIPGTYADNENSLIELLIDNSDNLYLIYERQNQSTNKWEIVFRYYNGASWSAFEVITGNMTTSIKGTAFFDGSWQIHLFYEDKVTADVRIKYTVRSGGSWSSPVLIYDTGYYQYTPYAFLVGSTKYLFWLEKRATDNYWISYTYNSGSGWSTPVLIGETNYRISYAKAVLNGSTLEIIYSGKLTSVADYTIYYFQFDGTDSSSISVLIVNTSQFAQMLKTGLGTCFSYSIGGDYYFAEVTISVALIKRIFNKPGFFVRV